MRSTAPFVMAMLILLSGTASPQIQLSFQGEPYFDGAMTMSLEAPEHVGEVPLIAFGLLPLTPPAMSDYGPYHIGLLLGVIPTAPIGPDDRVDLSFAMSTEDPGVVGVSLIVQGFLDNQLSNPATLTMAYPYFVPEDALLITSPNPMQQANFGDRVALGDLNDDGHQDIIVGAWFEDYLGIEKSGRVYIFWGPDFATNMALDPVDPKPWGEMGNGFVVADLDGDGIDDLVVAEDGGDGTLPTFGYIHVYYGDAAFSATPSLLIQSPGTGSVYSLWGRKLAVGDLDGDSFGDIVVGVDKATINGFALAGRVDVYWGPTFAVRAEVVSPTPGQDGRFGVKVACADANGDGIDDLFEASCGDDVGGLPNVGSAHIFTGPALQLYATIPNPFPAPGMPCFGLGMHAADLDGDGIAEAIVSDEKDRVFVFGGPDYTSYQIIPKPPSAIVNPFGETSYGYEYATGDINSDGLADLLITDIFDGDLEGCFIDGGGVVFGALGPYYSTFHRIIDVSPACENAFGWTLALGDIDGDNHLELIVGSVTADGGGVFNTGHATIFDLAGIN